MATVYFDTETAPFVKRGKATVGPVPRLVCVGLALDDGPVELFDANQGAARFVELIRDTTHTFVGHNVVFDFQVMVRACREKAGEDILNDVFVAYEQMRVYDTMLRAKLRDIASGGSWGSYELGTLAARHLRVKVAGKKGADAWRLRYHEIAKLPIDLWPEEAVRYAKEDVNLTRGLFKKLGAQPNETFQATAHWPLSLMSTWGVMVDQDWAAACHESYDRYAKEAAEQLASFDYAVKLTPEDAAKERKARGAEGDTFPIMRPDGTKSEAVTRQLFKDAWEEALGRPFDQLVQFPGDIAPVLTDTGNVSTSQEARDELERLGVEHPVFEVYSRHSQASKFLSTYLEPILDAGDFALSPRFNVLVDSGRTSSSNPNVQNLPARDKLWAVIEAEALARGVDPEVLKDTRRRVEARWASAGDIRGCFVPREGTYFVDADYSAIEMAGLAQVCYDLFGGLTPLGEAINNGDDLHLRVVVAGLVDVPYDEAIEIYNAGDDANPLYKKLKNARQIAKIQNYGAAGGASPRTIQAFARIQGHDWPLSTWERVNVVWHRTWSEMKAYFDWISRQETPRGYVMHQQGPGHKRRGWRMRMCKKYTQAANTMFQGIVADGGKLAAWNLARECYTDESSVLFGSRPIFFVHDEFLIESPQDRAEECAKRLASVMEESMAAFIPNIKVEAEPKIMRERWEK